MAGLEKIARTKHVPPSESQERTGFGFTCDGKPLVLSGE